MASTIELPADNRRYRIPVQEFQPEGVIRATLPVSSLVHSRDNCPAALQPTFDLARESFAPADWMCPRLERCGEVVAYERVRHCTRFRVNADEKYERRERARRSSQDNLTLGPPCVHFALSPARADEVVAPIRLGLLHCVGENHVPRRELS